MSTTNTQASTANNTSLTAKLVAVFGAGSTITANYKEDGRVLFYDEQTKDSFYTALPEGVELIGYRLFKIDFRADSFDFTALAD
jgi:hypothetical protein